MTSEITNSGLFSSTSRLAVFILALLWYLFYAIGFFRSARKDKLKTAWLAWLPFIQFYVLGDIVKSKSKVKFLGIILVISQLVLYFFFYIAPLNLTNLLIYLALLIITYVIYQYALNLYYKILDPDKSFLYLMLGILFPFLIPIWVLVLTNPKHDDYDYY